MKSKKVPKIPNPLFEQSKELIGLYLTKGDALNWGREIKIAKKLLSSYPIEFFRQYDPLTKFHSLSVFLTNIGKKQLDKEYDMWKLLQPKEEIKLESTPIIILEENDVNKKAKTLLEFVDDI